jgi:hypothetical protein
MNGRRRRTAVAVLIVVRRLGAEPVARRVAPFLVFGPAVVWQAVSADAALTAVAAWCLCALAVAATGTCSSRQAIGLPSDTEREPASPAPPLNATGFLANASYTSVL